MLDIIKTTMTWLDVHDGFAIVALTFIMLLIHIIFVIQNRKSILMNEIPEVIPYIHPTKKGIASMVDFSIINCGKSPAYNLSLSVDKDLSAMKDAGLYDVGHKTFSHIPILPNGESLTTFLGSAITYMKQDVINELNFEIKYESSSGKKFIKEFSIPIKYLDGIVTVGKEPYREIADNSKKIAEYIRNIERKIT
ncbi:hypothetical protein [Salidesulfovibrio onnuriiensis]|uniref:hypothetical protein n=1 Tax=Salidesulfovibrio onnuriiensis TaxID=2583823 RepID=UPI0011CCD82E|nr:hypothetical protein [Salidesulfovibrio onnuriiensis]